MAATTKLMLIICIFGVLAVFAMAIAAPALNTSYANQDKLVEITKIRNAGYLDDENGFEITLSNEEFAQYTKQANDFISKNREALDKQSNNR